MSLALPQLRNRDRILLVEPGRLHPAVVFTRASTATYMGADGLLHIAAANAPRYEYDAAGNYLGLLLEESRTNRALWCRNLANAAWAKTNMAAALTQTGLDGAANSATLLTATAANATAKQTITDATSRDRAVSFCIKRVIGTGTVNITADGGATWTACAGLSSSAFTRYTVTVTNANPVIGVRIVTSGDAVAVDFSQCEDGAFATSYIPTTSASITRADDSALVSNVALMRFSPSAGTMLINGTAYPSIVGFSYGRRGGLLFRFFNTAAVFTNQIVAGVFSPTLNATYRDLGASGYDRGAGTANSGPPMGSVFKAAMAWEAGVGFTLASGGSSYTEVIPTLPPFYATGLDLAKAYDGSVFNGWKKSVSYYPRRLTNTELQALTA